MQGARTTATETYRVDRRSSRRALLGVLCLLWAGTAVAAAVSAEDDSGQQVSLERPAARIVSLAPHLTELLFAAGAGERLVGTVQYSDYPPGAQRVARIGGYENLDLERIVALRPDLVVAWGSGNGAATLAALNRLGLRVFVSEPRRPEDIPATLRRLGEMAGTGATAEPAAAAFERRLAGLSSRYADRPAVSVFYQVWHRPLMTVGGGHLISRIIELCGGRNIFEEMGELAPAVSIEAVIAKNPQVIVASGMGEERPEWLDEWRRWKEVDAVAHGQLHFIPPDLLQRPTPRALEGAERLCRALEEARAEYTKGRP